MILYGEILPDKEELLNKLREFKNIKNIFNNFIERTIDNIKKIKGENVCIAKNVEVKKNLSQLKFIQTVL